ncbi:O-ACYLTRANSFERASE (WSD1-LIKE) FAMILY PROTEIN [Salix purpurea]|uniref:O-ACYLTRANSFERASE (WSD1-LIKE) FAMILY PROTEIN n=1 Tax=Salix purpurea TaxID=77065 RepID=A0A9Q0V3X3_SALPP|nr:O-ACYLTRANSFERASE (WSD1-LIKE) FAMILY PROTEIN [Salix purpurea]
METLSPGSGSANSSSLVLLNTRVFTGYKSIEEMVKPNAELPWGNHFAFLNIPLPKLRDGGAENPLQFVFKAREIIKRKRMSSFAVYLTTKYLQLVSKFRGAQLKSSFINSSRPSPVGESNVETQNTVDCSENREANLPADHVGSEWK